MIEVRRVLFAEELEQCRAIRRAVFVVEQNVAEAEEWDAYDARADAALRGEAVPSAPANLIATIDGAPVGTARVVVYEPGAAKVQRVAVVASHRGRGVGRALMTAAERLSSERGDRVALLDAQLTALPFYERLGYVAEGGIFLDAGIEHRRMRKALGPVE
jgi:ElaA protein